MSEWAEFGGVIGRYRNESTPWWPDPVRAPAGAPNVLVVLLDDEGLGPLGYGAYAVGKWHLTPDDERHLGASRARWPLRRGFDRFYGFFGGETHQFAPSLVSDSHRVAPPRSWEDGYHLSEDIADRAMEFVADLDAVDPDKPFFLYLCTGACHSPHHAPPEWIERYRGHFDAGWDAWRERSEERRVG